MLGEYQSVALHNFSTFLDEHIQLCRTAKLLLISSILSYRSMINYSKTKNARRSSSDETVHLTSRLLSSEGLVAELAEEYPLVTPSRSNHRLCGMEVDRINGTLMSRQLEDDGPAARVPYVGVAVR